MLQNRWCLSWMRESLTRPITDLSPFARTNWRGQTLTLQVPGLSHDWFAKIKTVCPLTLTTEKNISCSHNWWRLSCLKNKPNYKSHPCNLFTPPCKSLTQKHHPANTLIFGSWMLPRLHEKKINLSTCLIFIFDIQHMKKWSNNRVLKAKPTNGPRERNKSMFCGNLI